MTLRLALRSLASQPIRSIVLAFGFGSGIAAMAGLLGIGEVILEQSRSPARKGGGDVMIVGATGRVANARYLLTGALAAPGIAERIDAASPSLAETLYLVRPSGPPLAVRVRGGIPSLERAVGDPEVEGITAWRDAPSDAAWSSPDPADVLRAMDRFHAIPDVPERADSWAEWLYFNGRSHDAKFYLSFLVGPRLASGRRQAIVRLQLDRGGRLSTYSEVGEVSEDELLSGAPDLEIGRNTVRLDGLRYHMTLALSAESDGNGPGGRPDVSGQLVLQAVPGRSMPPMQIRGAAGWVTGYVVPVLSGPIEGSLEVRGDTLSFDGGEGYHDHNWGFWEGVTWQWGQVAHEDWSIVYGRVHPPADAADPRRVPGLLVVFGPDGPLGFATDIVIEEFYDEDDARPGRIVVDASSSSIELNLELTVEQTAHTRLERNTPISSDGAMEFLQLRAVYRVSGRVAGREVEFTATGAAETFRGH